MNGHRNAKLGLAGRRALVLAIERGMTLKAAAAAVSVAAATVHRWWHRWRKASPIECRTLFPDDAALVRLTSMLAIERDDEWLVGRRYLSAHSVQPLLEERLHRIEREEVKELQPA